MNFSLIYTPLIANGRFLSVFQNTIYKVKIIDLKLIRLYKVSSKVAIFSKKFLTSNLKVAKVSCQEKTIEKVQICKNSPTFLIKLCNVEGFSQ
jgi:hypothetical protein